MLGRDLLAGTTVVEFGQYAAGPCATTFLADAGAEVIKVEPFTGDPWRGSGPFTDTEGRGFLATNRGKRGIALDLKNPDTRDVLERLILKADIVLTNYRQDALRKLGIDYETIRLINPEVVYVAVSALEDPPDQPTRAGYDLIGQAASGALAADEKFTDSGAPLPISAGAMADVATAYVSAFAAACGLLQQRSGGGGMLIETSLLASTMGLMTLSLVDLPDHPEWNSPDQAVIRSMAREGSSLREIAAWREKQRSANASFPWWYYRCFETADCAIAVACLTEVQQASLLAIADVGVPEMSTFNEDLEAAIRSRPSQHWLDAFAAASVPATAVRHTEELFDDPYLREIGVVAEIEEKHPVAGRVHMAGPLFRVDGRRSGSSRPSPTLGQHNEEILMELGFTSAEIAKLRLSSVVRDIEVGSS